MTDPITDMLNRIRNAQAVFKETVVVPFSNLKYNICQILEKEGFIDKLDKVTRKGKRFIKIILKYVDKRPAISGLKRISKPGQRIYTSVKDIKCNRGKYGIVIISTPKGVMTNKEAKKRKLGGEVICEIW